METWNLKQEQGIPFLSESGYFIDPRGKFGLLQ